MISLTAFSHGSVTSMRDIKYPGGTRSDKFIGDLWLFHDITDVIMISYIISPLEWRSWV